MQFFVPYDPPKKWSLLDLLYWVAFQKMPVSEYDSEGTEIRESSEFAFEHPDGFDFIHRDGLTARERKRLRINEFSPQDYNKELVKKVLEKMSIFSKM